MTYETKLSDTMHGGKKLETCITLGTAPADSMHERNLQMIDKRSAARAGYIRPMVGDYVRRTDGAMHRFAHAWDDGIQTSKGGSFYLNSDGSASMSGGLDPSIAYERLRDTGEKVPAVFWFFHNNRAEANNGIQFYIPVRVFQEVRHD